MNNQYVAIMAGGIGSRFWPQSRVSFPKQFLDILGTGKTLIQSTYERFKQIVPEDHIYIVTGIPYVDLVKQQLPSIQNEQIVAEPARKNTGPCVAYIAHKLAARDPKATFVVAPSDHLITEEQDFKTAIQQALQFAATDEVLVTLGILPHRPDTGYGYIQYKEGEEPEKDIFKVKTFTEKPSLEIARTFLDSGDFLWNSGIFIWQAQSIIQAFQRFQPEINDLFKEGKALYNTPDEATFIKRVYGECKNISIDYAIMEDANNVYVRPSRFGWSDLGTWNSVWKQSPKDYLGNVTNSEETLLYNAVNCLVQAPKGKLVVIQGLENFFVVDTKDALLICRADQEQAVKKIHGDIKRKKGEQYL